MAQKSGAHGAVGPIGSVAARRVSPGERAADEARLAGGIWSAPEVWLTARYDGEHLRVSLVGRAMYGAERGATAALDLNPDETAAVRAAFDALLAAHADRAAGRARIAAARSLLAAVDAGEEVV